MFTNTLGLHYITVFFLSFVRVYVHKEVGSQGLGDEVGSKERIVVFGIGGSHAFIPMTELQSASLHCQIDLFLCMLRSSKGSCSDA